MGLAVEVEFHDVSIDDQFGGDGFRHEKPVRVLVVTHAEVSVDHDDALADEDVIPRDEVGEKLGIGRRRGLRQERRP